MTDNGCSVKSVEERLTRHYTTLLRAIKLASPVSSPARTHQNGSFLITCPFPMRMRYNASVRAAEPKR